MCALLTDLIYVHLNMGEVALLPFLRCVFQAKHVKLFPFELIRSTEQKRVTKTKQSISSSNSALITHNGFNVESCTSLDTKTNGVAKILGSLREARHEDFMTL